MALISCPECGKQISETTPSCPHCGYALSVAAQTATPTATKIGEPKTNNGAGIALTVIGIVLFVAGLPLLVVIPLGVVFILAGSVLLCMGLSKVMGTRDVHCPYCGKPHYILKNQTKFKCPTCRKKSYRDGEYLKPIM